MWMSFATTLNVSLGWLKKRYVLAAVFGALGGPLAYFTGFKLGGVEFSSMSLGLGAQALGWGVLMPLLTILADRLNGMTPAPLLLATDKNG